MLQIYNGIRCQVQNLVDVQNSCYCALGCGAASKMGTDMENASPAREGMPVKNGMAEYLKKFDKSPYTYPPNDRQKVEGVSTLKGSWRTPAKEL